MVGGADARPAHHAVLRVQHVGVSVVPLEERPVQSQALQMLILDHRPQLLVVPKKNHLEDRCGSDPQTQRHPARPMLSHLNLPSMHSLHPRCEPQQCLSSITTCLTFSVWEKFTRGMRVSGSVAMPASSTKICRMSRFLRLAEAAHEHVQRMTWWRSSSNFLAFPRIFLYLRRDAVESPTDPMPGYHSTVPLLTWRDPPWGIPPLSAAGCQKL